MKTQIARVLMRIATIIMYFCAFLLEIDGLLPNLFSSWFAAVLPIDPGADWCGAETFGAWLFGAPAIAFYFTAGLFIGGLSLLVTDRTWWIGWALFLPANLLLAIALIRRISSIVLQPFPGLLGLLDDNVSLVMVGWCILVSAIGLCLKCLHREDILKKPENEDQ